MKNKTRTYRQRVRGLKELIADGEELGFSKGLIEGYKRQLSTTQGIVRAERRHLIVGR